VNLYIYKYLGWLKFAICYNSHCVLYTVILINNGCSSWRIFTEWWVLINSKVMRTRQMTKFNPERRNSEDYPMGCFIPLNNALCIMILPTAELHIFTSFLAPLAPSFHPPIVLRFITTTVLVLHIHRWLRLRLLSRIHLWSGRWCVFSRLVDVPW
jgi:hypothetical protein